MHVPHVHHPVFSVRIRKLVFLCQRLILFRKFNKGFEMLLNGAQTFYKVYTKFSFSKFDFLMYLFATIFLKTEQVLQGCGNTMPDLSDQVPFHSGQVENFLLLVLDKYNV